MSSTMKQQSNTPSLPCRTLTPPPAHLPLAGTPPGLQEDEKAVKAFGVDYGEKMCNALLAAGAPGLHFYTLNLEKVMEVLFFNFAGVLI